jgi:hypothetical protein
MYQRGGLVPKARCSTKANAEDYEKLAKRAEERLAKRPPQSN